ncbi:hypothetical protein V6N12_027775 [Hibiscus sabdariffa]|uniref:Cytochrome P450 CYP749A22-like n=1 Tax=Hibiscus sabdariffa TaxID=183260 RepID=A0ABR2F3V5_9ROSI
MLNSQGNKGPTYRFIHGNNKHVAEMRREAVRKSLRLTNEIFPHVQPHMYSWINKYGKNYLCWDGARAEIVVSDPESVRENMIPAVITSVETLVARWKGQEGKEIEVFGEFKLMTSEVISRTAFSSKSEKLAKEVQDIVLKIVKKREDKVVNGEADGFGNDFLGLLVNAYHDPDERNQLSLEDLVDECKTFYFGGQETVSSLLSWTVLLLAIHGDWQEKARREVIDTFCNQIPHPEGLAKLKIITMIIYETLRLYGPSAGLMRKVGRQVQLGKVDLPSNIDILVLNIATHHDPQIWGEDVHLFKPERFAEGIAKAINHNAGTFFPFELGPRSCVGMSFATNEAKIALSMILQRYTFTLSPAYVHSPISFLTLKP